MAESTVVKNMRDGTLVIKSGLDSYTVSYEGGNLSVNNPGPSVSSYLDRGRFTSPPSLRYNEDQPGSGSFSAYFRDFGDGTDLSLPQFYLQSGIYGSGWASTLGANAEVPTLDLEWTVAGLVHGDAQDRVATWNYCVITGAIAEGNPNLITLNFTSYALYPTLS